MIQTLEQYIIKPLGAYCDETTLRGTLKRRLTKKEYKLLMQQVLGTPPLETLMEKLALDEAQYTERIESLKKKLNSDRVKRELFC